MDWDRIRFEVGERVALLGIAGRVTAGGRRGRRGRARNFFHFLAFGFGMDIDVLKHFYISANVRANYSFTDMRNKDLIDMIGDQDFSRIFSQRANLLIGAQIGLHWTIGGNRSFKAKSKTDEVEELWQ